jgi:hypothetical protein
MSQATGQAKVELFATSETRYFLKVEPVEVEFVPNPSGTFDLVVYQGGQKLPGKRK